MIQLRTQTDREDALRELRERGVGAGRLARLRGVYLCRYGDISTVLTSREWSLDARPPVARAVERRSPPPTGRIPTLFAPDQTPNRIREFARNALRGLTADLLETGLRRIVRHNIAEICSADERVDVMREIANPVMLAVSDALVGLPLSRDDVMLNLRARFHQSAEPGQEESRDHRLETGRTVEAARARMRAFLFHSGTDARRFAHLSERQRQEFGVDDDELVDTLLFVWLAGANTGPSLIAETVNMVASRPAWQSHLRTDPKTAKAFVSEVARLCAPSQATSRVATKETSIAGQRVSPGDIALLFVASGNHDPRAFPEPETIQLDRANRPLSFGLGIHFCLGERIAQAATAEALRQVLDAFHKLEPLGLERTDGLIVRTISRCEVRMTSPTSLS